MANLPVKNPPEFTDEIPAVIESDKITAELENSIKAALLNNDIFLQAALEAIVETVAKHMNENIHVTIQDKANWNAKAETTPATAEQDGLLSAGDKGKLDDMDAGAEVNQNAYSNIKVGNVIIQANGKTAAFTLEAGNNITLTGDNASKKIIVSANRDGGNADMVDGHHAEHFATADHGHDGRYYTKAESDTLLKGKAASSHSHNVAAITGLPTSLPANGGNADTAIKATQDGNGNNIVNTYAQGKGKIIILSAVGWYRIAQYGFNNDLPIANGYADNSCDIILKRPFEYSTGETHYIRLISHYLRSYFTEMINGYETPNIKQIRHVRKGGYAYIDIYYEGKTPHRTYCIINNPQDMAQTWEIIDSPQIVGESDYDTIFNRTYLLAHHICGKNHASAGDRAFVIGNGSDYSSTSNAFSITQNGMVKAASTITASTVADYAEFFEWQDGNPVAEDRVGLFVAMDGDKIRIANETDDYILGIVSGQPFVLGNGDCDVWNGMYLRDKFNRVLLEPVPKKELVKLTKEVEREVQEPDEETGKIIIKLVKETVVIDIEEREVLDKDGNLVYEGTQLILNPKYDPNQKYISRFDRPEWAPIGMVGVLAVYDDGTCQVNGYCKVAAGGIATRAAAEYKIIDGRIMKGYRVIERVADNIVKVIFR